MSVGGRKTIPDQLNELARQVEKDLNVGIACCLKWKQFRDDDAIGEDIAEYAKEAFSPSVTPEQIDAIQNWPSQPLRLLKGFVVQYLDCPRGRPILRPRYEGREDPKAAPSISISINGDEATIVFTAPKIV